MTIGAFEKERSPQGQTIVVVMHSHFLKKVDGFVCRPCIKEDGVPYGIDLWLIAQGARTPRSMYFLSMEWPVKLERSSRPLCVRVKTLG